MTDYLPGQRIRLVHTDDPHTRLQPGDTGTVRRHHRDTNTVDVNWESGSCLAMLLDASDRIAPITELSNAGAAVPSAQYHRDTALAAARSAGNTAGRDAADWWGQHTVGGLASGDVRPTARRILADIEDGDPAILDGLPLCDRSDDSIDLPQLLDQCGGPRAEAPTSGEQADLLAAYADAYYDAVETRVVELCQLAAGPAGTDLRHLHPDRVDIGSTGVFSGEWAITHADDGDRYTTGFVGVLVGRWNGWAVFTCTRTVADAIVADLDEQRRTLRDSLRAGGMPKSELDGRVDETARLYFDGDVLVADLRTLLDDPEAIDRVHPDADGRYTVMGRIWCWDAVDPYRCDQIVGDVPAPNLPRGTARLRHTPQMRLPHDRLRLANVRQQQTRNGLASTGALLLDDVWAATVTDDTNGPRITGYSPYAAFGRQGMRAYLAGCDLNGAPVTEQRLLAALADEYHLDAAITEATAEGGTQVRLIDDTGRTRALRPLVPAPRVYGELLRCAHDLVADTWPTPRGRSWQIWTGSHWTILTNPH